MKRSYYKQCNEDHNFFVMRKSITGRPKFQLKIWDYSSVEQIKLNSKNKYYGMQEEMLVIEASGNTSENYLLLMYMAEAKFWYNLPSEP